MTKDLNHFSFKKQIKGYESGHLDAEVKRILAYVGLENDMNKRAKALSGGMRRRLSVAMAFVGDSKVIILDEVKSLSQTMANNA